MNEITITYRGEDYKVPVLVREVPKFTYSRFRSDISLYPSEDYGIMAIKYVPAGEFERLQMFHEFYRDTANFLSNSSLQGKIVKYIKRILTRAIVTKTDMESMVSKKFRCIKKDAAILVQQLLDSGILRESRSKKLITLGLQSYRIEPIDINYDLRLIHQFKKLRIKDRKSKTFNS